MGGHRGRPCTWMGHENLAQHEMGEIIRMGSSLLEEGYGRDEAEKPVQMDKNQISGVRE